MIMNKKQQTDLTNGPIVQTLAKLALPIMASSFLGTAYNITDMAWIGVLGSKAVAGVGTVSYTHLLVKNAKVFPPFAIICCAIFS